MRSIAAWLLIILTVAPLAAFAMQTVDPNEPAPTRDAEPAEIIDRPDAGQHDRPPSSDIDQSPDSDPPTAETLAPDPLTAETPDEAPVIPAPIRPAGARFIAIMAAALLASLAVIAVFRLYLPRSARDHLRPDRPQPPGTPPWGVFVLGALLIYLAEGLGAASAHALLRIPSSAPYSPVSVTWLQLGQLAGAIIAFALLFSSFPELRRTMGLAGRPADLLRGLAALALIYPLVFWASVLAGFLLPKPDDAIAHELLDTLRESPMDPWWWSMTAMIVIVVPTLEELLYRGLLQTGLLRLTGSPAAAIGVTSAVFTSAHIGAVEPQALVSLFVLSLGFGYAFERTGRLAVPIAMHMIFNGVNIAQTMGM